MEFFYEGEREKIVRVKKVRFDIVHELSDTLADVVDEECDCVTERECVCRFGRKEQEAECQDVSLSLT